MQKTMPNKIDIVDKNNQPTGRRSTIDQALLDGAWHRGAHIVVYTKTGYVLVQKRSKSMQMHPGFLDISCGGFVDAGEAPEQAAVRELKEELGLSVRQRDLQLLEIRRRNHAWPSKKKHGRAFIYCYAVGLPDHAFDLTSLQTEEVEWARFIPLRKARRLVRLGRIKKFGRINPYPKFYGSMLKQVSQLLKAGAQLA